MDVAQLTQSFAEASKLSGQEQRKAYGELVDQALKLFGNLPDAVRRHKDCLREGYVHPLATSDRGTFEYVFDSVPGLEVAYHVAVEQPLFAGKKGYWDSESGRRYWRNASDTLKGEL